MKTFNVNEDKKLNQLAVAFAAGNQDAGNEYAEILQPKLTRYAMKKFAGDMSKEDLAGEFLLVAVEMAYDYADRYVGKSNILPLIYKSCDNKLIDLGRKANSKKRSRLVQVGDETFNREVSLQTQLGEDGESTMADKVAADQKSIEEIVENRMNETTLQTVVNEFVASTKGRNSQIIPLVYKANIEDWDIEELNAAIASVLETETGKPATNDAIRQAKSRAMKALRTALIDGKITVANLLEWEF